MCLEGFKKFTKQKYNVIDAKNREKLLLQTLRDIEKNIKVLLFIQSYIK